jgi:hypothetical protein
MDQSVQVLDTRAILLRNIEENPGIRYRELLRLTGLVNGDKILPFKCLR